MLMKIKELRKTDKQKCMAIYNVMRKGNIKRHFIGNDLAFDTDEWENYKQNIHYGRYSKNTEV